MRTLRFICSDPNATDSSSDEETIIGPKPVKRVVRKILVPDWVIDKRAPKWVNVKKEEPKRAKGEKKDPKQVKGEKKEPKKRKFPGCRQRKWGSWVSEIRDPFLKKRLWLGTFGTGEQAYAAYLAKKAEFAERLIG